MFVLFGLKMKTLNIFSNHLLHIANFSIFYRVHINVLDSVRNLNAGHCNNSPSSFVFARQRGLKGRVSGQFMIRSITRHCESRVQVVYNQLINVLLNLFILVWTSKSIFMSRYLGDKSAFYIVPTSWANVRCNTSPWISLNFEGRCCNELCRDLWSFLYWQIECGLKH